MIVYVSIGNSDDKLTQAEWAEFCDEIVVQVAGLGHIHGAWHSLPNSPFQNACWCVEFDTPQLAAEAREAAAEIGRYFKQDSVAWAVAETEFI